METETTLVDGLQFRKPGPDAFRRIGNILHHMWGEPDFGNTLFLQETEDGQGVLLRLDTIIQTIQDVTVVIHRSCQESAFQDGFTPVEQSEHQAFLSSSFP